MHSRCATRRNKDIKLYDREGTGPSKDPDHCISMVPDNIAPAHKGAAELAPQCRRGLFPCGLDRGPETGLARRYRAANAGWDCAWNVFRRWLIASQFTTLHHAARYSGRRLLYFR
jgi:hypothetical protein